MSTNTFDSARDYADMGFVPLPLAPNSKIAILPNWTTLRPRTLLRRVRPSDNLGLRLGRQTDWTYLFAIDVDPRHDGDLQHLLQNRKFPSTAHAITPGGGDHYLLRSPYPVRTRIGLVQGVDLLGVGSLVAVEPSTIDGRSYLWLRGPQWGVAPCPSWLLADLRRGGLLALRCFSRRQSARNTLSRPQGSPKARKRPSRPQERPGLLASLLVRYPVVPGQRNYQLIRMIRELVNLGHGDQEIITLSLAWWGHWYQRHQCKTAPDGSVVHRQLKYIRRTSREPSGGLDPFLFGLGGTGGPGEGVGSGPGERVRYGPTELAFLSALLIHFARESLLSHPLDFDLPATNNQLIDLIARVSGKRIAGKELRDLKKKFISGPANPATKFEVLMLVREGYRIENARVPSYYRLTAHFAELWERFAQPGR